MVYLDNAATSFPKPDCVINGVNECIRKYCGNPGRSSHWFSLYSAEKIFEAREAVLRLLNYDKLENVIFTSNATHALNLAIKGALRHKCHIITSDFEHNSVLRPLYTAQRMFGCEISSFDSDMDVESAIENCINPSTEFIVTSIASNVTGKVIDPEGLYRISKKHNLKTIIDASQYLGHASLDLGKTPFDFVASPGHKALFGLQGTGFLVMNSTEADFPTLMEGGSGTNSHELVMPEDKPERFEAGTLNTPGIVSLALGINYLIEREQDIYNKICYLTSRLHEILSQNKMEIYGCENGIAAVNMDGMSSEVLAQELAKRGIAIRAGVHCAPSIHKKLGTQTRGVVRISLSALNNTKDLDKLNRALRDLK